MAGETIQSEWGDRNGASGTRPDIVTRLAWSNAHHLGTTIKVVALAVFVLLTAVCLGRAETGLPAISAYATLKASVTVDDPIVRLGDLVSGAGAAAETPIFMAPEPGLVGRIDAATVIEAALGAGLSGVALNDLDGIEVRRFGTLLGADAVEALLRDALADRLGASSGEALKIAFNAPLSDMATATAETGDVGALDIRENVFEARIRLGRQTQKVTGTADVIVPALVLTRPMNRGEVLDLSDLTFAEIVRPRHGEAVPAYEEAVGFAVTRALKAGTPVLAGDLMRPIVMSRGAPVTLVHRTGRMTLTARGSALQAGRIGDIVDVLNTQSRRIVQARVRGSGEAEALGPANAPTRVTMR